MAQFDVYANPSAATRQRFPFLVDVQNPVIEELATRIVIPLAANGGASSTLGGLTPTIELNGKALTLCTPQIAAIPKRLLRAPVENIGRYRTEIISALDFAVTGV